MRLADGWLPLLVFGPAVIAIVAVGLLLRLWTRVGHLHGAARIGTWILIALLAATAFGIGCCYAAVLA